MATFVISWDCTCSAGVTVTVDVADQAEADVQATLYDGTHAGYSPAAAEDVKCASCDTHRTNVTAAPA